MIGDEHPATVRDPAIAEEQRYAATWRRRRRRWVWGMSAVAIVGVLIICLPLVDDTFAPVDDWPGPVFAFLLMLPFSWYVSRIRCPRCGESFDGFGGPYRSECQHCRLPANAAHDMPARPPVPNYWEIMSFPTKCIFVLALTGPLLILSGILWWLEATGRLPIE